MTTYWTVVIPWRHGLYSPDYIDLLDRLNAALKTANKTPVKDSWWAFKVIPGGKITDHEGGEVWLAGDHDSIIRFRIEVEEGPK